MSEATRAAHVLFLENSDPPMMFNAGEGFHREKLPAGTRVIYPPAPVEPLADPGAAIERALLRPMGMEPLHELLRPGMRLTIAFDDISIPLPLTRRPDVRELVVEKVLEKARAMGVEDLHLIAALGLHRRMTEAEFRHCLGDRVVDEFYPERLYNYDAEDEEGNVVIGETERGEEVRINRRAAESDLLVYVNVNYVAMNGGHKSVHTGLSPYSSIRHHHNPATLEATRSLNDPPNSALHGSLNRMGELLDGVLKVFHVETTLNNEAFPSFLDFMAKPEHDWGPITGANFALNTRAAEALPAAVTNRLFQGVRGTQRMTSVQAGATDPVHEETLRHIYAQQLVHVEGQADVLLMGVPAIGPYNVNAVMNPILVHCMLLGYLFNLYKGKPLVRKGGVLVATHPAPNHFDTVQHPSYVDFYEEVLTETTDPHKMAARFEERYARDSWYRALYHNSHAYHGVHPFYMWYWGAHALDHLGGVILVGGDPKTCSRMGYGRAASVAEALEMARDTIGSSPSVTYMHAPPVFACEVA